MSVRFERCVVVGTGLIGASLAAAGRRAGALAHVVGVGRKRPNLDRALELGLVDSVSQELGPALSGADLVVVATPVLTVAPILEQVAAATSPDCLVTDAGSVKAPICLAAERAGLGRRFVGAHPMAGSADTGSAAADIDLFKDRITVITPGPDSDPSAVARIRELWEVVGSSVVELDAGVHDAVVAVTSHLPQMMVFALCAMAPRGRDEDVVRRLVGQGFRDTTRLGTSDARMWLDIADLNREALAAAMAEFASLWDDMRAAVEAGDEARLRAVMESSRDFKASLGK